MDAAIAFRRPRLFVDTGALVAVYDPQDSLHTEAIRFRDEFLLRFHVDILSSYYVLAETLNNLHRVLRAGRMPKFQFDRAADELVKGPLFEVLEIDAAVNLRARRIMDDFHPHFSFTDATTLALIERENIRNIFSFDRAFEWYPITSGHTKTFLVRHPSSGTTPLA
jgi:predicted nucleic acid-binding protein